jgi:hypothetical protein
MVAMTSIGHTLSLILSRFVVLEVSGLPGLVGGERS